MNYTTSIILAVLLSVSVLHAEETLNIYVSPQGNDSWDGSVATGRGKGNKGPLATLTKARDLARQMKSAHHNKSITIHVGEGVYSLDTSLKLGAEDSGTKGRPVAWKGNGKAILTGGIELSNFLPVKDPKILKRLPGRARNNVVQCDLKKLGIRDFGHISYGGFGIKAQATHLELSCEGETMTIARWPNEEWLKTGKVTGKRVTDGSGKPRGVKSESFTYLDKRIEKWLFSDDIWVHGYWYREWADAYLQVKSFDKKKKQVVIKPPHSNFGYKEGARYRYLNVLEELDAPKEYYLDKKSGMLYFWPPQKGKNLTATISQLKTPLIEVTGGSHIRIEGLTLTATRRCGISIKDGSHVVVKDCLIRNIGNQGIVVRGGHDHQVINCVIKDTGSTGVQMTGGDRKTLEPANFVVENCEISHFGKWFRTYMTGIKVKGVGMRISRNELHHAPHCAIHYSGNDFIIEYNKIYKTCLETADVGAIYTTRDWTARGTIIRYNYLYNNSLYVGKHHGSVGIYLDDFTSGQNVYGNVIVGSKTGIRHCNGRDNDFLNNIMVNCDTGIHLSQRIWAHKLIAKKKGSWDLFGRLKKVPYKGKAYAKYPNLANILKDAPLEFRNNTIHQNLMVNCKMPIKIDKQIKNTPEQNDIKNNHILNDPGFVSPEKGDYRLKADSPVLKKHFNNIPMAKIGRRNTD